MLDAGLGHKSEAIAEGKRARELLPVSKDALDGPIYATYLATIYAWVGEKDLALQELELSASIPCGVQYGVLKLSPIWDSLRDDPRFRVVSSLAPKSAAAPQPSGMSIPKFFERKQRRPANSICPTQQEGALRDLRIDPFGFTS